MPSRPPFDRELLTRVFFFTTFAFLLYQLFLLSRPFLPSLLLAAMLAISFYPAYKRLAVSMKNPNLASAIVTLGVVLSVMVPLAGFAWVTFRESGRIIPVAQSLLDGLNTGDLGALRANVPAPLAGLYDRLGNYLGQVNIDLTPWILENLRDLTARFSSMGGFIAANAVFTFFRAMILVIALFFMFRDGEKFFNWVLGLIPMETGHKLAIAKSAYETFRAVTIGVFLTAAAQGLVAMIGFLVTGVRLPVFLGLATAAAALLGAANLIALPVALVVMMERTGPGIFLLIWSLVVVGWLDNILKPILIGSRARMPFVLVFFSILGGIKMYGLLGLILGPMLVASVLAFIRIYKEAYSA